MKFSGELKIIFYLLASLFLLASCQKVNIEFGESTLEADPNITYLDNYKVDIATFKPDSFATSSTEVLSLGYHYDTAFGVVKAGTYVQIELPAVNPLAEQTIPVIFDSLELLITPSGAFYGDSSHPLKINVYRLSQIISDPPASDAYYYNTSSFAHVAAPIGQQTVNLYGKSGTAVHIRLSNTLGQELLAKFKTNNDDVSTQELFYNYFKGLYIDTDSLVTNSLAYFSAPADSVMIRLNYHDNGLFPEKKHIDFNYTAAKQFNNINYRFTNANLSAFINKKSQLITSAQSGNQSYLNTAVPSYIKLSFPTILNLKELHPYIKIVKAELVIKPDAISSAYPYRFPKTLVLYSTYDDNLPVNPFYKSTTGGELQNGNLSIDELYGENTNYSYDITSFINALIADGQFARSAILLYPSVTNFGTGIQRLIVKDQNSSHSVQLKLYVLGL